MIDDYTRQMREAFTPSALQAKIKDIEYMLKTLVIASILHGVSLIILIIILARK